MKYSFNNKAVAAEYLIEDSDYYSDLAYSESNGDSTEYEELMSSFSYFEHACGQVEVIMDKANHLQYEAGEHDDISDDDFLEEFKKLLDK